VITVHHLENSRSQRVLWLLEELGLPYELKFYKRQSNMLAPPELRQVHPLGKSPVIEDTDANGASVKLAETGAIIMYLVEKAGGKLGEPAPRDEALRYRQFLHYAEGSVMPVLFASLVLGKVPLLGGMAKNKFKPMVDVHLNYVESELASRPWFAGNAFTAADVMMSYPLEAARNRAGITVESHPRIHGWIDTIHARPAFQKALARGGPYSFA
jgi:glutathione S-transferase